MIEVCVLRSKTWAYRTDDDSEKKKCKRTKKCLIKRKLMFENCFDTLYNRTVILRSH